jgi:rRNA-processing protein FCF1
MDFIVVLDTNIPLLAADGNFRLTREVQRLIPKKHSLVFLSACEEELDYLTKKGPKIAAKVKFARVFLEKIAKRIDYNPTDLATTDEKIIQFAIEHHPDCAVITNDKQLRKQLRKKDIPVLFVRTIAHIELQGRIQ